MEAQKSGEGVVGMIVAAHSAVKSGLASTWNAVTKDGTIAAAMRQGADEIGMALKAFPDSIHVEEPGTILNPTQGEIASARGQAPSPSTTTSPSAIAKDGAGSVYGQDQGQAKGASSPSPSEIAKEQSASGKDMSPSRDQGASRRRATLLGNEETFWSKRSEHIAAQREDWSGVRRPSRGQCRQRPERAGEGPQSAGGAAG